MCSFLKWLCFWSNYWRETDFEGQKGGARQTRWWSAVKQKCRAKLGQQCPQPDLFTLAGWARCVGSHIGSLLNCVPHSRHTQHHPCFLPVPCPSHWPTIAASFSSLGPAPCWWAGPWSSWRCAAQLAGSAHSRQMQQSWRRDGTQPASQLVLLLLRCAALRCVTCREPNRQLCDRRLPHRPAPASR